MLSGSGRTGQARAGSGDALEKALEAAGIDLLVLRDLMGHTSPETTAGYVHLSAEHLAAEYAVAQASLASSRSTR